MSFGSRHGVSKFNFNSKDLEYKSLKDLLEEHGEGYKFPLRAIYINTKSQYGAAPVLGTDGCMVNLPSHKLEECEEIRACAEDVSDINEGKAAFTIYTYTTKSGNTAYSVNFVDND